MQTPAVMTPHAIIPATTAAPATKAPTAAQSTPSRNLPLGSTNLRGLFTTYAYRFWVCGFDSDPRMGSALTNRPISGSYWRVRRYSSPVGSSFFSPVNLCGSGWAPDVARGLPNGSYSVEKSVFRDASRTFRVEPRWSARKYWTAPEAVI